MPMLWSLFPQFIYAQGRLVMTWRYTLIKHQDDGEYYIHEYFPDQGAWTADPIDIYGKKEDIVWELTRILEDITFYDPLDEKELMKTLEQSEDLDKPSR